MRYSTVLQSAKGAARAGLSAVFPPACPKCNRPSDAGNQSCALCDHCITPLILPPEEMCPRCAICVHRYSLSDGKCPRCRHERLAFERIICLGPYRGELGTTIVRMKNMSEQPLTYAMGQLIGRRLLHELDVPPDLLVPIPMHWQRRIRRGCSSADILAKAISRTCEVPAALGVLRTTRRTEKQSLLSPAERRANVKGAFQLPQNVTARRKYERLLNGQHVGLVDDAVTTGATVNSAARTLKNAGAAAVSVFAVARANR